MSVIIPLFVKELEKEASTTRKMLERVPSSQYSWKPHPKSMSLLQLATHLAELPGWISMTLTTDELDFAANPYTAAPIKDEKEMLAYFEKNLQEGSEGLGTADDNLLRKLWTLRNGKQIYSESPKSEVIRMTLSQIIHHRAQLGVYLRLLDIPIPGSYGPSADDHSFN